MDDNPERPAAEPPQAEVYHRRPRAADEPDEPDEPTEPLLPVSQHALETGNAKSVPMTVNFSGAVRPGQTRLEVSWQHAAAAQLHGWAQHVLSAATEFRCTRADYLEALAAASAETFTRRKGRSPQSLNQPHRAALSPYARRNEVTK